MSKQSDQPVDYLGQVEDLILECAEKEDIERSHIEVIKKRIDSVWSHINKSKNPDKRDYFTLHVLSDLYLFVLEGGTPEEAYQYILEKYQKPEKYINSNKNKWSPHLKEVCDNHDNHPKQKKMRREGIMDKNTIKHANTPNQQLNRLHKQVVIYDKLEKLKNKDKHQQKEIDTLKIKCDITDMRLDALDGMTPKEKARILKSKGYTQKTVAKEVNKDLRTIKRWWKEL